MSSRGGQKIVVNEVGRLPYFSHASVVGDLIFVSGTLGTLPAPSVSSRPSSPPAPPTAPPSERSVVSSGQSRANAIELIPGGIGPETRQTLENIRSILRAAGADLEDVAKVSVYVTDMADFAAMNAAYAEFFPPSGSPPARITLSVAALALGAAVEIECIATKP